MQLVFRFAPSPNGYLHLGHAYSALLNQRLAQESGGRLLLRIEDIDPVRCKPELVAATVEDLAWLGFAWQGPVMRQSEQFDRYRAALDGLRGRGLVYPCFCSRKDIVAAAGHGRDPDGSPIYPGTCRRLSDAAARARINEGMPHAWRLDAVAARAAAGSRNLTWLEADVGLVQAEAFCWGDVVLARKETPTSYHLAVVIDDAFQGVTHVVRGKDLYAATAVHRLLQEVLGLPQPQYRHHELIRDASGDKLAKSRASIPLRQLRADGVRAADLRRTLGF